MGPTRPAACAGASVLFSSRRPDRGGGLVLTSLLIATPQGARFVVLRVLLIPSAEGRVVRRAGAG